MILASETLKKAKEKIKSPYSWTKDSLVKGLYSDGTLRECHLDDEIACCWCSIGAVMAVVPDGSSYEFTGNVARAVSILNDICRQENGFNNVAVFNDSPDTTHQDVMEVFDRAIEVAERREAHAT
jgi:hypothetical protein